MMNRLNPDTYGSSAELTQKAEEEFTRQAYFIREGTQMIGFDFSGAMEYSKTYLEQGITVDQVMTALRGMYNYAVKVQRVAEVNGEAQRRFEASLSLGAQKLAEVALRGAHPGEGRVN